MKLYSRVHHHTMVDDILPLHFARGQLEESRGSEVNWAAFAMRRCFPGHKKTPFEPYPDYADVRDTLPWMHSKVLPLPPLVLGEVQCNANPKIVRDVYVHAEERRRM
ncbi:hypothetical protein M758_UG257900 [Ceratodon purpureus]|nr:hypothetical protein M758_UG257900 [Ceratodon purpureus]